MFIVFVGPPGVGKGTQCGLLAERLDLRHVSTGDMLRKAITDGTELGMQSKSYLEQGKLVPDEIMVDLIGDYLEIESPTGILLDGFPRTLQQAEALDYMLQKRDEAIDIVIELYAEPHEIMNRLAKRAQAEARADDNPLTIKHRLDVYQQKTRQILDYYQRQGKLRRVDGLGTPEEVYQRIIACISARR
jgi:adenylate kinase